MPRCCNRKTGLERKPGIELRVVTGDLFPRRDVADRPAFFGVRKVGVGRGAVVHEPTVVEFDHGDVRLGHVRIAVPGGEFLLQWSQ